ncbi:hypothetical protein IEO21_05016 [Rhodonia placenta]|uniref:Uncharacterized protein n=1 Tax=Rhodonia placenta TaxID=104341 RepID=A0A8H7U2N1_9APHY|nr:hypothetical protein IEO21_05016 [Postia placenta]
MYVLHAIVPYGHRYARGQTRPRAVAPLFQQPPPCILLLKLLLRIRGICSCSIIMRFGGAGFYTKYVIYADALYFCTIQFLNFISGHVGLFTRSLKNCMPVQRSCPWDLSLFLLVIVNLVKRLRWILQRSPASGRWRRLCQG